MNISLTPSKSRYKLQQEKFPSPQIIYHHGDHTCHTQIFIDWLTITTLHPTYIMGDMNAKHRTLGHNTANPMGKILKRLINLNKLYHLGPYFATYHDRNSATTPDIVLSNDKTYHNILIEQGPLTTSGHIPIICKLTVKPMEITTPPRYDTNNTDWEDF